MKRIWMTVWALLVVGLAGCGGSSTTVTVTKPTPGTSSNQQPTSSGAANTRSTASTATRSTASTGNSTPKTQPITHLGSFQSPSSNISCIVVDAVARCDIKQRDWNPPPRPASCPDVVDFGQGLDVGRSGPGRLVCAGDTTINPADAKLAYGVDDVYGGFNCASRVSGMTCTNVSDGHGFFISIQSYRTF